MHVRRVPTALGGMIVIEDAPEHMKEGGVMLHLRLQSPEDMRHAEIYLNQADLSNLIVALEQFQGF